MVIDESIKRSVVSWAIKIGPTRAVKTLKRHGVGERMARYLIKGKYDHDIGMRKATAILKAIK